MPANLNAIVGTNVRISRKRLGLNQDEFADKCGLHRTYIGAVERGERNITLETLQRIAAALEVSPLLLLSPNADLSPRNS
ncbi:MAG: helix-turn-helix transcriptional regulator [Opitutaceae bacterium]|jgi:transcriptional regulator with XRE-family HTH domain